MIMKITRITGLTLSFIGIVSLIAATMFVDLISHRAFLIWTHMGFGVCFLGFFLLAIDLFKIILDEG